MLKRLIFFVYFFFFLILSGACQELKTKNLILVTIDGLRWQEIFEGPDSSLVFNSDYSKDKNIRSFVSRDLQTDRARLLPFFWNTIGVEGQLYGNRNFDNFVNCANPHWFSYPGYSELLTGFIDRRIKSNLPIENPNETILEFISKHPGYEGRVAAFATWDVFPFILRENISKIHVNAGADTSATSGYETETLLNDLQSLIPNPHGARFDAFTFYHAFEYLKRESPRVLFIALDETDEHGHGGRYDEYLKAAHRADKMIAALWRWIQSDPGYKDQTTMIITTDHGRGKGKNSWTVHGRLAFGSGQAWLAILGPDTPGSGEMKVSSRHHLLQIPATMSRYLGLQYSNVETVGQEIHEAFGNRASFSIADSEIGK